MDTIEQPSEKTEITPPPVIDQTRRTKTNQKRTRPSILMAVPDGAKQDQIDLFLDLHSTFNQMQLVEDQARQNRGQFSTFKYDRSSYDDFFDRLESAAKIGLDGAAANTTVAVEALKQIREEFLIREAGAVKRAHLNRLGFWVLLISGLLGVILTASYFKTPTIFAEIKAYLIIALGVLPGVWVSFGVRKQIMTFADLYVVEEDQLTPVHRLVFVGILAVALGAFIAMGLISITGIEGEKLLEINTAALLFGFICGFSENALANRVQKGASRILGDPKKSQGS